jgi:hypothetical protein
MALQPIETHYAGCRFRSRLEARWAVFMDQIDVTWEYEFQGFRLPSGRYLPDFRLPHAQVYLEIKGSAPTKRETTLAVELAAEAAAENWRYRLLAGDIPRKPHRDPHGLLGIRCLSAMPEYFLMNADTVQPSAITQTSEDGEETVLNDNGFGIKATGYAGIPVENWRLRGALWRTEGWTEAELTASLIKARCARFEHGETPSRPS